MPMMDLLVQATTASKISPGGHVITLSPEGDRDNLHYKPSTPIGSLDTNTVYIMSKSAINDPPAKKVSRAQLQPFEPTFRLQVNLPRNQLMVMRVSPKTTLAEIKKMVCMEKGFDSTRYHLVHPTQPNYLVDLNCKLSDYGGTEISLLSDLNVTANIRNSTSDLIGFSGGDDEKKRKKLLGIFKRKSKSVNNMMIAGEAFRDTSSSRGVSPARSDICDTRSLRAKRQSTKKRAPPPPPVEQSSNNGNTSTSEISVVVTSTTATTVTTTTVSHSRQSSDSSGYHEASVLSDCPDNLSPETSGGCASGGIGAADSPVQQNVSVKRSSRTPTRDKPNFSSVASTMMIISTSKKRRAPPPPPLLSSNKGTEKTENKIDFALQKDHSLIPTNEVPTSSANSVTDPVKVEVTTTNLSSHQPASPDHLSRISNICESKVFCTPPAGSDDHSSESSSISTPTHSPSFSATVETEMSNGNATTNHCRTEEETGEVIHLLEKGADIFDNSSIIEDEVLLEFIPPPLEFATPIPPPEYNGCDEKAPHLFVYTNSNFQDVTKIKSTPTPQPRLTRKISPQQNKACRRSLNFSDITDEKSRSTTDLSAQNDADVSEHLKVEFQSSAEEDQLTEKDSNENSVKIMPVHDAPFSTEDEYAAMDEVEWDFNIPEPPSPFRNSVNNFGPSNALENEISSIKKEDRNRDCDTSVESVAHELLDEKENIDCSADITLDEVREKTLSTSSTDSCAPPLPSSFPPRDKTYRAGSVNSDVAPPLPLSEPPLASHIESNVPITNREMPSSLNPNGFNVNTSLVPMSNYKSRLLENESEENETINVSYCTDNGQETGANWNQTFIVAPQPRRRAHLQNFTIGSYKNDTIDNNISWNPLSSPSDQSVIDDDVSKNNVDNSFNMTVQKIQDEKDKNKNNTSKYTIEPYKNRNASKSYSSWDDDNMIKEDIIPAKILSSIQNSVNHDTMQNNTSHYNLKKDDSIRIEEERLQEEYKKLQNQLIVWQQQLLKNQTLLQQKQIVSEMDVPIMSSVSSDFTEKQMPVYRSQTLPRPKPTVVKDISDKAVRSSTMEYHSSSKPQVLTNVTIGSWKSKSTDVFNSNSVADMKPKFQTLAPIISLPQINGENIINKRRINNDSSLNYETKARNFPQVSATFELKSVQRDTKEHVDHHVKKTDGHPELILAQIRNEIKANSRHPAGISIADTDSNSPQIQSNPPKQSSKICIKSKPHVTYSYFGNPSINSSTNETTVSQTNKHFSEITKNNNSGTKPVVIATKSKFGNKDNNVSTLQSAQEVSPCAPPPPPPPPPILPPATVPIIKDNTKFSDSQIRISRTESSSSDAREELMIEIRKFGGRTALRKVPPNQVGWHLKVFGTLSSTPV